MHRLSLHGGSVLVTCWLLWANFWGLTAVALAIAWAVTSRYATVGPVVAPLVPPYTMPGGVSVVENPRVLTPKVFAGGSLVFRVDFERYESCRGTVVETFRSADFRSVQIQQRTTQSTEPRRYYDVEVTTEIPPGVYPGRWTYEQTVESFGCPGGKRKVPDSFAKFDFEVLDAIR